MAGSVADRELSSRASGSRVHFTLATLEHDAAIRRLLRAQSMEGAVQVSFQREPSFFGSTGLAGADDDTILAFLGDELAGMGRLTVRPCWAHGAERRVAYLGELRLGSLARGRSDIVRGGFEHIRDLCHRHAAEVVFTSVAADNHRARRLLERGLRGFPRYRYLAEFVTLLIPVRRAPSAADGCERKPPARIEDLADLLNRHGRQFQLAPVWSPERLRALVPHGLTPEAFSVLGAEGEFACAALWDQRHFRQTVIRGYAPALRLVRPVLNAFGRIAGRVELPPVGATVPYAFASPLAANNGEALVDIVAAVAGQAGGRGVRLLTLGFDARDSRLRRIRNRFGGREYRTRLYQVSWSCDFDAVDLGTDRLFLPDVALL